MRIYRRFWQAKDGATAIEYALIGTLVSIAVVFGASQIGTKLNAKFTPISNNLN